MCYIKCCGKNTYYRRKRKMRQLIYKYIMVLDFMKMLIQNIIQGSPPPQKKSFKIYWFEREL